MKSIKKVKNEKATKTNTIHIELIMAFKRVRMKNLGNGIYEDEKRQEDFKGIIMIPVKRKKNTKKREDCSRVCYSQSRAWLYILYYIVYLHNL